MSPDPIANFGSLLHVCVREDSIDDKIAVREGVLFLILGVGSSVATTYALSLLGFFV